MTTCEREADLRQLLVKRDEQALRRSEALLAAGQEMARTGSWAWNASSGEWFWSPEHFRIFGFPLAAKAPPVEDALRRLHPEDRPSWEAAFGRAVTAGTRFAAEGRVVHPDGSTRYVRSMGRPVLDEAGRTLEYVGILMDTTDEKQAKADLAASERRFRQLAEAIPHHVWTLGLDGAIRYSNQRLMDYTGLTAEELRQGGWAALHPDDVDRVRAAWRHASATGAPYEAEQRMRGRDGRYRRFMRRVVAVRDAQGRILEWFGTDSDVEARRAAEEAVDQARTELARVNRAFTVGELTASIAHELNQPLAAVVANASACERWLQAPAPDIAEAVEALRRISRDATRASEVIARIRALLTRRPLRMAALRIEDVIRDVLLLVQRDAGANNVAVRATAAEGLTCVTADRVQLEQVVLNLVLNAIEAMGAVAGPRKLDVHAQPQGTDGVLVAVRDSGGGVNPRIADKVFDAFFTTKAEGMGMGLAICRSIVEAHGGALWATNNAGAGATFQFTLPAGLLHA